MKCTVCKSEWNIPENLETELENCPFCGNSLNNVCVEEVFPNDIVGVVRYLFEKEGIEVFSDSKKIYAYISDLVSNQDKEKKYIRTALKNNFFIEFKELYQSGKVKIPTQIKSFEASLLDRGFSGELVSYTLMALLVSVGGKVIEKSSGTEVAETTNKENLQPTIDKVSEATNSKEGVSMSLEHADIDEGELTLLDGRYVGQIKDGQPHGYGKIYYKNGNVFDGQFFEGKKDGEARFLDSKRQSSIQLWEMGSLKRTRKTTNQNEIEQLISDSMEAIPTIKNNEFKILCTSDIRATSSRQSYVKSIKMLPGSEYDLRIRLDFSNFSKTDLLQLTTNIVGNRIVTKMKFMNHKGLVVDEFQEYIAIETDSQPSFSDTHSTIWIRDNLNSEWRIQRLSNWQEMRYSGSRITKLSSLLQGCVQAEVHMTIEVKDRWYEGSLANKSFGKCMVNQCHWDVRNFQWEKENGAPDTKLDAEVILHSVDEFQKKSVLALVLRFLIVESTFVLSGSISQELVLNDCIVRNVEGIPMEYKNYFFKNLIDFLGYLSNDVVEEGINLYPIDLKNKFRNTIWEPLTKASKDL